MSQNAFDSVKRLGRCALLIFGALLGGNLPATAGDWTLVPRFSILESFTDNLTLVDDSRESDFITQITPGVSLRGEGARISSSVDYNLQHQTYARNDNFNDSNHQLQGSTDAELLKNRLFVNTRSTVSQQLIDRQGRVSTNTRSRGGNRTDTITYTVSPTLRQRFGDWAAADVNFQYATVTRSAGAQTAESDSNRKSYTVNLRSGLKFARLPMSVRYQRSENSFDSGTESEFSSVVGDVSYIWSRKLRFTATGGKDFNSFQSSQGSQGGVRWTVGGSWTPSRRTSLSGQWGKRFFGETYQVSANHRHRRWNFGLNYNEEVSTSNRVVSELQLVPLEDGFGNPFFDPATSDNFLIPVVTNSLTEETFINKRLSVNASYAMRRTDVNMRYSESRRELQQSGEEDVTRSVSGTITRRVSTRTRLSIRGNWSEAGTGSIGQNISSGGDFVRLETTMNYDLGPHTISRFTYTYAHQGSSGGTRSGYTENELTASLVFHF